jgi:hypothetical protein
VIDLKRHTLQSNSAPETTGKQSREHRLKIGFPTGAALEHLLRGLFVMIAIPNSEHDA